MSEKLIRSIAVMTSGGDSPGMNCAIRSVVRAAIGERLKVYGVKRGYQGLINNEIYEMNASSVGSILHHGGTILYTSRCPEFKEKETRAKAAQILEDRGIDALVVIGGDGSFKGAKALHDEFGISVIGIPGTIDNDISGTDYTIGFDTAVQTAMEAVDKIRDTATSSDRTFLIEVMGARSSSIALKVGICSGAENILLNTEKVDYQKLSSDVRRGIRRGKNSSIIIVAEGESPGRSYQIAKVLEEKHEISSKVCVLGHIQRGGSPTPDDRFFASVMGKEAVGALLQNLECHAVVVRDAKVHVVSLGECMQKSDHAMINYLGVSETLSI
ncbi:MAG: 6-phosphofructokinase [Halobacteriovoraceae bacterium]|nr:6-phosphofructokinase [Peredibacter sp.]MBJ00120.1 6-phosphofructokinase [Halobacteriovoraceae bacterium]|tara:strand:+ start:6496 stop:7479 length:984 start_codon:yes stop_codon:yes gene_type:complete